MFIVRNVILLKLLFAHTVKRISRKAILDPSLTIRYSVDPAFTRDIMNVFNARFQRSSHVSLPVIIVLDSYVQDAISNTSGTVRMMGIVHAHSQAESIKARLMGANI